MSSFAHGSSGSSPAFNPPSRSMLPFEPPPTHGPVRSTCPSGSRGMGWLVTWLSGTVGLPPTWIWPTLPCAWSCTNSASDSPAIVMKTPTHLFTRALLRLNQPSRKPYFTKGNRPGALLSYRVEIMAAGQPVLVVLDADV